MSKLFYQTRQRRPVFERGEGIYIWDTTGKKYIDGSSGPMTSNLGHANPNIIAAMKKQIENGTFAYRLHFENEPAEKLAEKISQLAIGDLEYSFFVSGGSEAVESAIKIARQYAVSTGQGSRYKIIARDPGYHGSTLGALSLTSYDPLTDPFLPLMLKMPRIPSPTCYLEKHSLDSVECGLKYAAFLEQEIEKQGPENILAFIMEPVGGAATGALVAPDSYYPRIREICDYYGVLLIYDEVMSGAGRTGKFLAADHWSITPDIVAMSKGFSAGYCPFGVTVAPDRLVDPILDSGGFQHGFTYAGNPLACATALAVLEETQRLDLYANVINTGNYLMDGLNELQNEFDFIGDVRGKGFLTAIELVSDRETMTPFPANEYVHEQISELAYNRGLILYSRRTRGGNSGDHIMVCPPLITNARQIDEILSILHDCLSEFTQQVSGN